ncbi:hypothetical protein HOD08_00590 [bacterium]|nr:hypothetical protein [bacterium]
MQTKTIILFSIAILLLYTTQIYSGKTVSRLLPQDLISSRAALWGRGKFQTTEQHQVKSNYELRNKTQSWDEVSEPPILPGFPGSRCPRNPQHHYFIRCYGKGCLEFLNTTEEKSAGDNRRIDNFEYRVVQTQHNIVVMLIGSDEEMMEVRDELSKIFYYPPLQ